MSTERLVILGGGASGIGAAKLAAKKGIQVFLSDAGKLQDKQKEILEQLRIPYEEGGHTWETILTASEVVKSPGIPDDTPLIRALNDRGIPVISEVEFAARYTNGKIIGITGSNGKTTTTLLTWHLLKAGGLDAGLAGNVGIAFAEAVAEQDHEWWVLELSSFQLDNIQHLKPTIAMLLNITPDHLDRYDHDIRRYGAAKMRIGMNQQANDLFLYRKGDPRTAELLEEYAGQGRMEPMPDKPANGSGQIEMLNERFDLRAGSLRGLHNWQNAAFAIRAALETGIAPERIQSGLTSFRNAPHRLERVGTSRGIEFINDSKATNVDAVWFALDAMEKPVIWIAGGTDKGNDYEPINGLVRDKVKALICMGVDNEKLKTHFHYLPRIRECRSATMAVELALEEASPGDVVLLSPACASFDLFKNYEDRGDQFRDAVEKMVQDG